MSDCPREKESRKRTRQVQFDLNRSTPQVLVKAYKSNTPNRKSSANRKREINLGMDDNVPLIFDKSQTINTQNPSTSASAHQEQHRHMEDANGKAMEQSVSSQVGEMRRQMAELTAAVGKISLVLQHTQQENKKLR